MAYGSDPGTGRVVLVLRGRARLVGALCRLVVPRGSGRCRGAVGVVSRRPNYGHVELPRVEVGPETLARYLQRQWLQSVKVASRQRAQRNALLWSMRRVRELLEEGDVSAAIDRIDAAERRHAQLGRQA
jgi:hypothetical protein